MIAEIQRTLSLPEMLTIDQVAALAHVGRDAIHKAVFLTRQGERQVGDPYYLVRRSKMRAGFHVDDVLAWLAARKQTPAGFEAHTPKRRVGLARESGQ